MHNIFKLLEIDFFDHPVLGSLSLKFYGEGEENAENYTSLLIGPNGIGKSQILLAIIDIFNSVALINRPDTRAYKFGYGYACKYNVNGEIFQLTYDGYDLLLNRRPYNSYRNGIPLPVKMFISSYSFNDKYPLRKNRGKVINEDYYYLGLKSTTNSIFIYNPPKEAIDNLYGAIQQGREIGILEEAFRILDLKPEMRVVYKPGRHFKFLLESEIESAGRMSEGEFKSRFRRYVDNKRRRRREGEIGQKRLGDEKVERVLNEDTSEEQDIGPLLDFVRSDFQLVTSINNKQLTYQPLINFSNPATIDDFSKHIIPFRILRDLEILSFDRFEINKLESGFSFDNSSSGEYHILISFLNLLSLMQDNSLVLIDEPEISLHPNWQIRYMDVFCKIFKKYKGTHFIISSHSHFLVSDLKGENSFIGALFYDHKLKKVDFKSINRNTYGWSAEQILLDVFNVATTRNYFITKVVTDVLKELGQQDPNFQVVKNRLKDIVDLDLNNLRDNDPLQDVLSELVKLYYEI